LISGPQQKLPRFCFQFKSPQFVIEQDQTARLVTESHPDQVLVGLADLPEQRVSERCSLSYGGQPVTQSLFKLSHQRAFSFLPPNLHRDLPIRQHVIQQTKSLQNFLQALVTLDFCSVVFDVQTKLRRQLGASLPEHCLQRIRRHDGNINTLEPLTVDIWLLDAAPVDGDI